MGTGLTSRIVVVRNLKDEISEAVGVKQLDLYNFGFRNMTVNKPLVKLGDFQKLKLRFNFLHIVKVQLYLMLLELRCRW